MVPLPKKCEDINTVTSFCDCMRREEEIDPAAERFCSWVADNPGKANGDNLKELKKALMDLEEADSGGCCCECE